jgi:hypothetical protein
MKTKTLASVVVILAMLACVKVGATVYTVQHAQEVQRTARAESNARMAQDMADSTRRFIASLPN